MTSDAILAGLLFATYVTMQNATAGGPGPQALFERRAAVIETLGLLVGSLGCGMALVAGKHKQTSRSVLGWRSVTLLLVAAFLGFELHDFVTMAGKGGVPQRSGVVSAVWALVPLHGPPVTAAMTWALAVLAQVVVPFRGFLRIRLKGQARDDLQLFLFTALVLGMMSGGTIWILHILASRM